MFPRRMALTFFVSFFFLPLAGSGAHAQTKPVTPEDQAVEFHRARAASRPDDADALRLLAGAYIRRAEFTGEPADYDRAWQTLERAEKLEPGDLRTLQARATLLRSRHRFPQARALAEHGLRLFPNDPQLLALAGDIALDLGELDSAEQHYRRLHTLSQRLPDWARLAHITELRGNLEAAAQALEKALEAGYTRAAPVESIAWCHAILGEVELKRGKPQAARQHYARGLEQFPDHPLVLEHLAELEQQEGNLQAAEAAWRRILARRPAPEVQLRLAELLEKLGKKDEAAGLREQALRFLERVVAEGNEGYLRPLAALELSAGRFPRAAALAARDLVLRPTAESRDLLARILRAAVEAGQPINALRND